MIELPAVGGCRCGECRYTFNDLPFVSYTCHCKACRKLTGSAFLTCAQLPKESLRITSGSPVFNERTSESGNTLRTFFCKNCGSTLYAENSARPRVSTLHVGSLDQPEDLEVTAHIWVKRKLHWVSLPSEHRIFQQAGDWRQDYERDPERYSE